MEIRDVLLTISMLGHFSYTLWAYIERRSDKTSEKIAALTSQVSELDKDVTALVDAQLVAKVAQLDKDVGALSSAAKTAPSHGDLGDVYESINKVSATVHELVGESRAQTATLRMIQSAITERGLAL